MILKCLDGPMDGAVYVLAKSVSVPLVPDGRSVGRVIAERIMMALGLDHNDFRKRDPLVIIACEIIDQNIPFGNSTNRKPDGLWFDGQDEHGRQVKHEYAFDRLAPEGDHVTLCYRYDGPCVMTGIEMETKTRDRPSIPDEVAKPIRDEVRRIMHEWCADTNCKICSRRREAEKQSYNDLAASGGIVDAP